MTTEAIGTKHDTELAVKARYAAGAEAVEAALCCPIDDYKPELLAVLPDEILERDYGCGDPSKYVAAGDVVLDLGSGGGKICYITSQLVGASGRVIGVDFNPAMLDLAERYKAQVGEAVGWHNVEFRKGRIQDLELDLAKLESFLAEHPVTDLESLERLQARESQIRRMEPLVASDSVDIVLSNCVLNLVPAEDKPKLFREIYRVVKRGGRVAISDIVCDEDVPEQLQADPELWSGCISGALREDRFLAAFEEAGFHGIELAKREEAPWQVVEGIEFRSVTVTAYKGKEGPCLERNQAVIYRGPFRRVEDDDQHAYVRGQLTAVCDKTFQILSAAPYGDSFYALEPTNIVPVENARGFDCSRDTLRHARELKGAEYRVTKSSGNGNCC